MNQASIPRKATYGVGIDLADPLDYATQCRKEVSCRVFNLMAQFPVAVHKMLMMARVLGQVHELNQLRQLGTVWLTYKALKGLGLIDLRW